MDINYAEMTSENLGRLIPLLAGDTPAPVTDDISITVSGSAIAQYVPLMVTAGAYVPWAAGNAIAAITAYALPIGTQRAAVYLAGMFNLDAIAWPATTTEAQVQAGAVNSMLRFRKGLYSNKRTGNEGAPGTPAGPA